MAVNKYVDDDPDEMRDVVFDPDVLAEDEEPPVDDDE